MWINFKAHSHLIHKNTLHVFNVNKTLIELTNNRIDLKNISKMKIYMCRSICVYSFENNSADIIRKESPWNEYSAYEVTSLINEYYLKLSTLQPESNNSNRRVTLIANSRDSGMTAFIRRIVDSVESIGRPKPFIERYSKQYIDFPNNNTIFDFIKDGDDCLEKIMIEITKDSELYLSLIPDRRHRYNGRNEDIHLIANTKSICTFFESENGMITVEDYCKWYSLFRIHRDENNNILVSYWSEDDVIKNMDGVVYYDHCPMPITVVNECKKHGVKLGYMSYLAMLCRVAEDIVECDPEDLHPSYISPKEDLESVLIWDNGSSEYYGTAKLLAVADKFGITCPVRSCDSTTPTTAREKLYKYIGVFGQTNECQKVTTKEVSYDSVIMCPCCFNSEPITTTQIVKIQPKNKNASTFNFNINECNLYRNDLTATCSKCGYATDEFPLIDSGIYPTIKILNEKGWVTTHCCEGHVSEYSDNETLFAYISFEPSSNTTDDEDIISDILGCALPSSWHIDYVEGLFGQYCYVLRVLDEVQKTDINKNYLDDILVWAQNLIPKQEALEMMVILPNKIFRKGLNTVIVDEDDVSKITDIINHWSEMDGVDVVEKNDVLEEYPDGVVPENKVIICIYTIQSQTKTSSNNQLSNAVFNFIEGSTSVVCYTAATKNFTIVKNRKDRYTIGNTIDLDQLI